MDILRFDSLPLNFDPPALAGWLSRLGTPAGEARLARLAPGARAAARARGLALAVPVEIPDEEHVRLAGEIFTSRLLSEKLQGRETAFPFLTTEGPELAAWAESLTDPEDRRHALLLRRMVILQSREAVGNAVRERWNLPAVSRMSPGELREWPLEEQRPLFRIFGPLAEETGVRLGPDNLMQPLHSSSGIFFRSEERL